jgi:lysophospholipase L1-like esterase
MCRQLISIISCIIIQQAISAQVALPSYPDSVFSTYYWQRVTHFKTLPYTKDDVIFLGNSITDGAEWSELFNDNNIKNRGISGDITAGVIKRLDNIVSHKPSKIFLLAGINDLARNISADSVVKNILIISTYISRQSPSTQLFVQSILPVNDGYKKFPTHTDKGEKIKQVNKQLELYAQQYNYTFINLYTSFCDENGKLKINLTNDGLHLKGEAYLLWKHIVYPYVYGLQQHPSLLPLPRQIQFNNDDFPLYACSKIYITHDSLRANAVQLQQALQQKEINTEISSSVITNNIPHIELQIAEVAVPECKDEAYRLNVSSSKIIITANTCHGIFNGMQTLMQLMRDNVIADGCVIYDWPAFSWRGYMVDAGRNFESVNLLKQQIDVMSRYKLNIFHFHFTEDIAWRLQSKLYPQLTAAKNMLRNKGMYYSENDLKELIAYCKERYITLVPEIDMPGHSAAFTRAMGFDMQSDSGVAVVKNILKEFCATYNLPYMHIGGDEVHVTNKNFMPAVINLLHKLGRTTIAWSPGADIDTATIRQLWMSDNGEKNISSLRFIDSRHLYINHMDPLESVVTIFFRQIGDTIKQTENIKGATLCLWPDRRVENEEDVLRMNPVYPAMLAFAERTWNGGGHKGWTAIIGAPSSAKADEFAAFENRLLEQKKLYFKALPFPYTKQTGMVWKLYGPYENNGNLSQQFPPETKAFNDSVQQPSLTITGGTIILRHWWAPLIEGALNNPKENTTWYAFTKIWSDEDGEKDFWIGFNNISRSPATDSPMPGTWDNHQSRIWVNGKIIEPPAWKHAGAKGDSEIPLVDEGYEYREPAKIILHKGWNTILIKAPIGSFKAKDWQNPQKWMFTCVPL